MFSGRSMQLDRRSLVTGGAGLIGGGMWAVFFPVAETQYSRTHGIVWTSVHASTR